MAGHSKWKNTKHRKAIKDIQRGKIFSKIIRDAKTAVRLGGTDITRNSRLRAILEKALSNNMTKHTFNRAVLCNYHELNIEKLEEDIVYEAYGPRGIALLLKCLTDNRKRLVSEIRYALSKFGGNLSTNGSVAYLFNKKGVISCASNFSEDIIIEAALKIGAYDISVDTGGLIKVYTSLKLLSVMELELKSFDLSIYESKIFIVPYQYVNLDSDSSLKLSCLIKVLKNINGVYEIYHNGRISVS